MSCLGKVPGVSSNLTGNSALESEGEALLDCRERGNDAALEASPNLVMPGLDPGIQWGLAANLFVKIRPSWV
jgi:uncharacterized protein (DUF2237 family)